MAGPNQTSPHPLDSMARNFDTIEGPENLVLEAVDEQDPPGAESLNHNACPALSPGNIKVPALLLDARLKIVWQNKPAADEIWHQIFSGRDKAASPDIFDLLFDPQFQKKVENWRRWVAFFMQQASSMVSREALQHNIVNRKDRQKDLLLGLLTKNGTAVERFVFSGRLRQKLNNGKIISFGIIASEFEQGRLFIFEPKTEDAEGGPLVRPLVNDSYLAKMRRQSGPVQMPVIILAADLNNADILRTEMLSQEYTELLNTLSKKFIDIIERYAGVYGKHTDSGLFGYFLLNPETQSDPLQVIECGLEIKAQISELGREWKIRKGWLHDIELNMGIHRGDEFVGTLRSQIGENLVTFGDALYVASNLSALAKAGEIWVTKEMINLLPAADQKRIRFGVFREHNHRRMFVSRSFARVKDLPGIDQHASYTKGDKGSLAITQVFDCQG